MRIEEPVQTITVVTKQCYVCMAKGEVTMPMEAWEKWTGGMLLQEAAPMLTPGQREQLISGTHNDCFDKLFPPDED